MINLKREKEAHTILEKLIQKYPDETIILNSWAFSLLKQGLTDKALQYINKALKIKPSYAAAYITRAQIFLEIGDREKACKDYTQAQKIRFSYRSIKRREHCTAECQLQKLTSSYTIKMIKIALPKN